MRAPRRLTGASEAVPPGNKPYHYNYVSFLICVITKLNFRKDTVTYVLICINLHLRNASYIRTTPDNFFDSYIQYAFQEVNYNISCYQIYLNYFDNIFKIA